MVRVAGGTFSMGSSDFYPEERPVHRATVNAFWMDEHPVTNAGFSRFVDATGYVTVAERAPDVAELLAQMPPGTPRPDPAMLVPGSLVFTPTTHAVDLRNWSQWWTWVPGASWRHPDGPGSSILGKDDFPVVQVAWEDAAAYAEWAGKRLPTEAEWERAARGGHAELEHVWGNEPLDAGTPQARIYEGEFPLHPAAPKAVGSYRANAYGLYDMSGNVWQWTLDWFRADSYSLDDARGVVLNPTGPSEPLDPRVSGPPARVLRGGSFLCSDSYCRGYRVSARTPGAPDSGASHIGIRTIMTVEQWTRWNARATHDPSLGDPDR